MNTKLHAICDSRGRPLNLFVTAGQVSDYIGARALLSGRPQITQEQKNAPLQLSVSRSAKTRGELRSDKTKTEQECVAGCVAE